MPTRLCYYLSRSAYALIILILLFSCNENKQKAQVNFKPLAPVICIQPFHEMGMQEIAVLESRLKKCYPNIELRKSIGLPESAYNHTRQRYRADTLIHFLARTIPRNCVVVGITNKDISTTKNNKPDWGVMGLGFRPGKACIASTFRLSRKNRNEELFKVAVHELGHTQGLPHCRIKWCFMRDANGKKPLNEETGFCPSCKKTLTKKGWTL